MLIQKESFSPLIWSSSRLPTVPQNNGMMLKQSHGTPAAINRLWLSLKIIFTSSVYLVCPLDPQRFLSFIVCRSIASEGMSTNIPIQLRLCSLILSPMGSSQTPMARPPRSSRTLVSKLSLRSFPMMALQHMSSTSLYDFPNLFYQDQ